MFQTLFHIPHEIAGIPVFGFGWALGVWAIIVTVYLTLLSRRPRSKAEILANLPVLLLFALAIMFVLPHLEEKVGSGEVIGLAIRGYGTLVLIGMVSGMAFTIRQASRVGIQADTIYSLAFFMFICGIIGARLFYVIQKWDQFAEIDAQGNVVWNATLGNIAMVTEGGLVIYGGLIGGLIGAIYYLKKHRLPVLAMADLIAPGMALGLAFGRLGCLMNGCCYGGLCELPWSVTFPRFASRYSDAPSPPYEHQLSLGLMHGIRIGSDADGNAVIQSILESAPPDVKNKLSPETIIKAINNKPVRSFSDATRIFASSRGSLTLTTDTNASIVLPIEQLPARSLPVHPTQVYSSINAALLFLLAWAYYPMRKRDGELIALLLTVYPITRFLLEIIRQDEGQLFGTGMTISQNVSLLLAVPIAGLWLYVLRQPRGTSLPMKASTA